ncbi:MAG: S8 family serine peptidase [Syntrophales bacterium]
MMFTDSGLKRYFAIRVIAALFAAFVFFPAPASSAASEKLNTQPYLVVEAKDGQVSIDARNAEITELLPAVAQKTKTNIFIGAGVEGKITVKLFAATIEEVLRAISQNSAVVYEYLPETESWRVLRALIVAEAKEKNTGLPAHLAAANGKGAPSTKQSGKSSQQEDSIVKTSAAGKQAKTPAAAPYAANLEKRPSYKAGELLVKFKDEAAPEQIAALHARLGSVVLKNLPKLRLQRIKLQDGFSEAEAIKQYQEAPIVEHAERHALRYPQTTPNDPSFSRQWNLKKIGAEALWNISTGSRDVIVAVIDSGVDYSHPDLRDNIWINEAEKTGIDGVDDDGNGYIDDIYGWDFANNDNNPFPFDPDNIYGHGTHVAGIVGAAGNNGVGVSGVNWRVRIMPLKVNVDNSSEFINTDIIEAIDYAIANGAQVVNCSFGGNASDTEELAAFARLREKGIIAACAAGNYSNDLDISGKIYPASYDLDNIISVANTDSTDALASTSNYGKIEVDVAAPGNSIYSTFPFSGTSVKAIDLLPPAKYPAIGMEYAALTSDSGITGALYDSGMGYTNYDCDMMGYIDQIPDAVSGNIALIKRGNCDGVAFTFSQKALNAQAKGAKGIIFYNDVVDDFDIGGGTLGSPGVWVPAVSITKADGEALLGMLSTGTGVQRVTLINKSSTNPYGYNSGTSMAAPHVAGLAGLIYGQCPSAGYADVRASIIKNVDKIPALTDKIASGGRINAFAALTGMFPPGDLSADCRIGLEDAILGIRILAGMETTLVCPLSTAACRLDTNNDGVIGGEEVIYILQKISGIR